MLMHISEFHLADIQHHNCGQIGVDFNSVLLVNGEWLGPEQRVEMAAALVSSHTLIKSHQIMWTLDSLVWQLLAL